MSWYLDFSDCSLYRGVSTEIYCYTGRWVGHSEILEARELSPELHRGHKVKFGGSANYPPNYTGVIRSNWGVTRTIP